MSEAKSSCEDDQKVQIFVLMPENVTYTHCTPLSAKVSEFIPRGFALYLNDELLTESSKLMDCGVRRESTLLARRLPGEVCPLTLDPFEEPVFTASLQTYEKAALFDWLTTHDTDPCTRQPLKKEDIFPAHYASPRYGDLEVRFILPPKAGQRLPQSPQESPQMKVCICVNWHQTIASVKHALALKIRKSTDIPKDKHFITHTLSSVNMRIVFNQKVLDHEHDTRTLLSARIFPGSVCFLVFSRQ